MEETVSVTLDFTQCKYIGEIYLEMRKKMKWEDWYGENLYALWDILTGLPHEGDEFTIIRPYHFAEDSHGHNQNFDEYVDKICEEFRRAERFGYLTVRIEYR